MKASGRWLSARRAGQILFPSLFVIPTLMLFVYLLFETTKLSREKIREQFAVDSAAFIQMGDYTNLLNRTAYVDGAFPYRIFKEAWDCPPHAKYQLSDESGEKCPFDMMYGAGAFPKLKSDAAGSPPPSMDNSGKWAIAFDPSKRPEFNDAPTSSQDKPLLDLITKDDGLKVMISWDDAIGYYKFYTQVYSLLGTVEKSQWTVFSRLTDNFSFFRKSYYLNANVCDPSQADSCGDDGVGYGAYSTGFSSNKLKEGSNFFMHYILKIEFFAKVYTGATLPPYYLGQSNPPMDMTSCPTCNTKGLFQLATVTDSALDQLGRGYDVFQGWDAPKNYFKVDFNKLVQCQETSRPCVHALITTQCPQLQDGSHPNNCVWPNPTPKYQTRLYP